MTESLPVIFPAEKTEEDSWDSYPHRFDYEARLLKRLAVAGVDESLGSEADDSGRIEAVNDYVEEAYAFGMSIYDINKIYDRAREIVSGHNGCLPPRQYARLSYPEVSVQLWPYPVAAAEAGIFILKPAAESPDT